jgi:hypothetical protein
LKFHELWQLSIKQRLQLYNAWKRALRVIPARKLTEAIETHSGVVAAVTDMKLRQQALLSARVVGLTTTRAAMQRGLLEQLKPGVVIVEEV